MNSSGQDLPSLVQPFELGGLGKLGNVLKIFDVVLVFPANLLLCSIGTTHVANFCSNQHIKVMCLVSNKQNSL